MSFSHFERWDRIRDFLSNADIMKYFLNVFKTDDMHAVGVIRLKILIHHTEGDINKSVLVTLCNGTCFYQ